MFKQKMSKKSFNKSMYFFMSRLSQINKYKYGFSEFEG